MDTKVLDLIATVVAFCEAPPVPGPGPPRAETLRVLATLRRFVREGTPWRSLRATPEHASRATLRRTLERWARTGLLARLSLGVECSPLVGGEYSPLRCVCGVWPG